MTSDQPNHEKELNKVRKIMSCSLPSSSEVFKYKEGEIFLLTPFFFLLCFFQAAKTGILLCDAIKTTNPRTSLCHGEGKMAYETGGSVAPWEMAHSNKDETADRRSATC